VATDDGGPKEIIGTSEKGLLVDPLDTDAIGSAVADALSDRERWRRWSRQGVEAAHAAFSWGAHARRYVEVVGPLLRQTARSPEQARARRLTAVDRMLVTDIDDTLTGDDEALATLRRRLDEAGPSVGFAVATGRTLERALELLDELELVPDVLITASGSELHYGRHRLTRDRSWERQISYGWQPEAIRQRLEALPGVTPGAAHGQTERRLHFELEPDGDVGLHRVRRELRKAGLRATVFVDHGHNLEIVPVRASPGLAIRFLCNKWGLEPGRLLVAGDSGNDRDMLSGDTLGVVVANHTPELSDLRGRPRIYFARGEHARGILEGIDHYDFLGEIRIPDEPETESDLEESTLAAR
jgi:sucrose-phosphate synthase